MSLWLCLRFNQLPLQALYRQQPYLGEDRVASEKSAAKNKACVVIEQQRVLIANQAAQALGAKKALSLSTIHALSEKIECIERQPKRESQALQKLCCWAYNISPTLYHFGQDCILIEIGSCLKLFGNIDQLLNRVHLDLSRRAWQYRAGIAATPKAAWLLSHKSELITPTNDLTLKDQLATLPLSLLSSFNKEVNTLKKAGLATFSDIFDLPYAALGKRCGKGFIRLLQEILGEREDGDKNFFPPESFTDDYLFNYEVKNSADLLPACRILLQSLCQYLHNRQLQCDTLEWSFYDYAQKVEHISISSTQAHSNWEIWNKLSCLKIEGLILKNSIETVSLHSNGFSAKQGNSNDLFEPVGESEPLHYLLDRLQNRLGEKSIQKLTQKDALLPEEIGNFSTNSGHPRPNTNTVTMLQKPRPLWLMPEPQPVQQRQNGLYWQGYLKLIQGPERIEDNWWKNPVSRDYYLAEKTNGDMIWIFLDRLCSQWFVHGIFTLLKT